MSKKWYGSIDNRIDENKMFCDKIEIGTGMTEYHWSDRTAYEVVEVINQEHVFVRELQPKHVGDGSMDNNWELISNPNKPIKEIKKYRGNWCWVINYTKESLEHCYCLEDRIYQKILQTGKATKYSKANVSFGVAEYYYDYEF